MPLRPLLRGSPASRGVSYRNPTSLSFFERHSDFVLNDSRGRQLISQKGKIQTVDPGGLAFPLHPELSTSPMKPDIAWFRCVKAPPRGGETLLCDGVPVVPALQPEVRASLERRSLRYRKRVPTPLLERWFHTVAPDEELLATASSESLWSITREGDAYFRSYTTPALHKPMFSESPAANSRSRSRCSWRKIGAPDSDSSMGLDTPPGRPD